MEFELAAKLSFLQELIGCVSDLYYWRLRSSDFAPIETNCPEVDLVSAIMATTQNSADLSDLAYRTDVPILVTNDLGLMWVTDFEKTETGEVRNLYILGPVFFDEVSERHLRDAVSSLGLSTALEFSFKKALGALPFVSLQRMLEYTYMLHFALTGEKISYGDLQHYEGRGEDSAHYRAESKGSVHSGSWMIEQRILKNVEDGNLDAFQAANRTPSIEVPKLSHGDPVRQIKNQLIILTALVTRASIRGGLDYETAYSLSDRYILLIEDTGSIPELTELAFAMQKDFTGRVHRIKAQSGASSPILKACHYIQLHLEEKISLADLSAQVGYAPNYLSKKFQAETGLSVSDYILKEKIEYAETLLRGTDLDLQEISDRLCFANQSYFGKQFKRLTGLTPGEYRKQAKS